MRSPYGLEITESCLGCKLRLGRFCDLPRHTLESFQALGFTIAYPKGALIFAQGQTSRETSVLCAGYVKLLTTSQTGKIFCLGIAAPGAVLGLSAAVLQKPHEVTAVAVEPCQLKTIKGDRFLDFLRYDGEACLAAVRCLSNDVRKTLECVRLLGLSHSVSQRLAKVLLDYRLRDAEQPHHEIRLRFPLTHRQLSQMLGVTRETVTRLLTTFERKKFIQHHGSNVVIYNERALRVLSSGG